MRKQLHASGVRVCIYTVDRQRREITYFVSSFFPFLFLYLSFSLPASSRSTYINFYPRTLSSKIRWTKRGKKKAKWEERRGREGRNKEVHYMSPNVAAFPLFLLRDVTRGDSLDYHLSLSLSLSQFTFWNIYYFWTTIITPQEQTFFFLFFFFLTSCNNVNNEKETKPNLSLSLSLFTANIAKPLTMRISSEARTDDGHWTRSLQGWWIITKHYPMQYSEKGTRSSDTDNVYYKFLSKKDRPLKRVTRSFRLDDYCYLFVYFFGTLYFARSMISLLCYSTWDRGDQRIDLFESGV